MKNKSLCIFINFNRKDIISNYVKVYVKELLNYFDELIIVTNTLHAKPEDYSNSNKIDIRNFKNEGYDFGLFFKTLNSIDKKEYYRIAFINDSNILFKKLDKVFNWKNNNDADLWGITDSREGVPGYKMTNTYHIQSHFLIFEKKAINLLDNFFKSINFHKVFSVKNLKERDLRLKIVSECEMGITSYMMRNGIKVKSIFHCDTFIPKVHYPCYFIVYVFLRLFVDLDV